MKLTILGSCRQDSLYHMYPVTSIRDSLTYPHYTKEVIQALEFCKGISPIPYPLTQSLFRSGILSKRPLDAAQFYDDFFTTDVFVIEIASRITYLYKGFYAHHIVTEPEYGFPDPENVVTGELTDEEIEADLLRIKELVYPKKCMVVSHIYTRQSGKRYELVKLLERLCDKHSIPFFDPIQKLGPVAAPAPGPGPDPALFKDEPLLSHYTEYGHSQIAPFYKKFIESL